MAWTDSLAYTEQGLLSVSLTDANATYSDEFQVWDRLGWVDAVDGGVSEGSGLNVPISDQNADYTDDTATFAALLVQLPTDANAAYDDSLEAFGAGFAQPAADPWETLAD